jgi:hypothetical protein
MSVRSVSRCVRSTALSIPWPFVLKPKFKLSKELDRIVASLRSRAS